MWVHCTDLTSLSPVATIHLLDSVSIFLKKKLIFCSITTQCGIFSEDKYLPLNQPVWHWPTYRWLSLGPVLIPGSSSCGQSSRGVSLKWATSKYVAVQRWPRAWQLRWAQNQLGNKCFWGEVTNGSTKEKMQNTVPAHKTLSPRSKRKIYREPLVTRQHYVQQSDVMKSSLLNK